MCVKIWLAESWRIVLHVTLHKVRHSFMNKFKSSRLVRLFLSNLKKNRGSGLDHRAQTSCGCSFHHLLGRPQRGRTLTRRSHDETLPPGAPDSLRGGLFASYLFSALSLLRTTTTCSWRSRGTRPSPTRSSSSRRLCVDSKRGTEPSAPGFGPAFVQFSVSNTQDLGSIPTFFFSALTL